MASTAEPATGSAGVQALIDKIRDDGIRAAKREADRILLEARQHAATITQRANAQSEALKEKTHAELEAHNAAAMEALQMAARDTVLDLKSRVMSAFERYVQRLVSSETGHPEAVKGVLLVLAGRAVEEFIEDKDVLVGISNALFGDESVQAEVQERQRNVVLGLSADMLREGIELIPANDVHGGARVQLAGEDLEIDLTDEAVTGLLLKYLLPRFKAVLEGVE